MKRKWTLMLLAVAACILFTVPALADGPMCGTESNPSVICSAAPPAPAPSLKADTLAVALDVLAFIL